MDLSQLSHAELLRLRELLLADQAKLGPLEHRAFAREWTQEEPWLAIPSLPFAIPAYTAKKALFPDTGAGASPASFEEMAQGYKGLWEGINGLLFGKR